MTEVNEVQEAPAEVPEVENVDASQVEGGDAAPATEDKKSSRTPVPAGWGTPIQFAKALGERLNREFKPQVVYSYINNRGKNNPFPVHYVGADGTEYQENWEGARPLLKLNDAGAFEEAMAWWDAKEERKTASATKAKEK